MDASGIWSCKWLVIWHFSYLILIRLVLHFVDSSSIISLVSCWGLVIMTNLLLNIHWAGMVTLHGVGEETVLITQLQRKLGYAEELQIRIKEKRKVNTIRDFVKEQLLFLIGYQKVCSIYHLKYLIQAESEMLVQTLNTSLSAMCIPVQKFLNTFEC